MPTYDYRCDCGHLVEDEYFATWRQAPNVRRCPKCRERRLRKVVGCKNFIHPSLSSMYGRPEPALGGDVIQDYAHKRRICKELGVQEASDRVHGAQLYQDRVSHLARPRPTPPLPFHWGDRPPAQTRE